VLTLTTELILSRFVRIGYIMACIALMSCMLLAYLQESDSEERVSEALASLLTASLVEYSGASPQSVYNPKEVSANPLLYIQQIMLL